MVCLWEASMKIACWIYGNMPVCFTVKPLSQHWVQLFVNGSLSCFKILGTLNSLLLMPWTQSHKKFSEWKQVHVEMESSKTNQTRWDWHHNTFSCALRRVVKGSAFCGLRTRGLTDSHRRLECFVLCRHIARATVNKTRWPCHSHLYELCWRYQRQASLTWEASTIL